MGVSFDIVRFPGLGLEIPVNSVAFTVFGLPIAWYAIVITAGIVLAWLYMSTRSRQFGFHSDTLFDIIFVALICGIVGARLYYVIFSGRAGFYFSHPLELVNTRNGGLAFYGGFLGGVLGALVMFRVKKISIQKSFRSLLDLAAPGFFIGQALGRWGNFFNEEAFGVNTSLPWGMTSDKIVAELHRVKEPLAERGIMVSPSLPVHPCFLYESIWCFLGFLLIHLFSKKRKFDGQIISFYLLWYGFGRFFIEGLRTDALYFGPLRVSQWLSLLLFVMGAVSLCIGLFYKKGHSKERVLYRDSEAAKTSISLAEEKRAEAKGGQKKKQSKEEKGGEKN